MRNVRNDGKNEEMLKQIRYDTQRKVGLFTFFDEHEGGADKPRDDGR